MCESEPRESMVGQRSYKKGAFKRRFLTGFKCHESETGRMFVLTESDEAIEKGFVFDLKFKKLVAMIRKKYGRFDYCVVTHRQGDLKRMNYHVVFFGSYIDKQVKKLINWLKEGKKVLKNLRIL
jgi:hypothetical protein